MAKTPNLNLNKPEVDKNTIGDTIVQYAENFDILDEEISTSLKDTAKFKKNNSTFTNKSTSQTFIDSFCTKDSLVIVSITSPKEPQGVWSVDSQDGQFIITSTSEEAEDITFDYFIQKVI